MDTKLTLRLDKRVIERAKEYAHLHHISLSKMIEFYLDAVTRPQEAGPEITPLVESLSGVIRLDIDYDYKKAYAKFLSEKHQ